MTTHADVDGFARQLLAEHPSRFEALRNQVSTFIDAAAEGGHPQTTRPLALPSPERDGVLCLFSCTCIAASDRQPITIIATKLSAVDRHHDEQGPTDAEALSFALALLGNTWFSQSVRDSSEVADPARRSMGVRLYLSSDFQPGVPEILGASVVPTVASLG